MAINDNTDISTTACEEQSWSMQLRQRNKQLTTLETMQKK